jgi:SPP1 gp7 family putative phage head morphogenesis protein
MSREVILPPVKSLKGIENAYRKELNKFGRLLVNRVKADILAFLKPHQSEWVNDAGIGWQLNRNFRKLNKEFSGTAQLAFATNTAERVVNKTFKNSADRFDKSVESATGVDIGAVITQEGMQDFVDLSISENVNLITSLPQEFLKNVEIIVNKGLKSGARYATIEKEIIGQVGSAASGLGNRIKTIARNEIQTINAQIQLKRSEALGIRKGIYRTSKDEVVRKCHEELDGVIYEISKGAWSKTCNKFIKPGITDINCRCSYSPILEL